MKISDLFSDNKNIATIGFYCQLHGITMPKRDEEKANELIKKRVCFFIFVDKSGIDFLQFSEKNTLIGKIVGGRLKRGAVFYFHDGSMRQITWENYAKSWKMLTPKAPKDTKIYDDRITVPKRKRTAFDDALPDRPMKKMSKRGFSRTINANISIEHCFSTKLNK